MHMYIISVKFLSQLVEQLPSSSFFEFFVQTGKELGQERERKTGTILAFVPPSPTDNAGYTPVLIFFCIERMQYMPLYEGNQNQVKN